MASYPLATTACSGAKPVSLHWCSGSLRSTKPRILSEAPSLRYTATARFMQNEAAYAMGVPP